MIRGARESEHPAVGAIALVVLLTTGVLAGCGPAEVAEGPPPVRPIKMLEIGPPESTLSREYPGRVAPALEAELGFEVPGRLDGFPVTEGQTVRRGQTLARLDASDYQAQLAATQANLKAAEADYERFRDLLAKNAVSERDFQSRERNFEVAQAQIRVAEKAVADTRLVAPFSGRVARKLVDDFQSVQAKQAVVLLQDESKLEIKIDVPEADMQLGSPDRLENMQARVTVTSLPGRTFEASIAEISTAADPVSRTFEATLSFAPDGEVNVLPGMTARVSITAEEGKAHSPGFSIPAASVATDDGGAAFVWKVDPQSYEVNRATVTVGELSGGDILVPSGLSQGDLIAVSGVHHLSEGMKVRRAEGR